MDELQCKIELFAALSAAPSEAKPLSKSQLKKLAKQKGKQKKVKPKWNAPGSSKNKKSKQPAAPKEKFVNKTPDGEKKDLTSEIETAYNPEAVEAAWDSWWVKTRVS